MSDELQNFKGEVAPLRGVNSIDREIVQTLIDTQAINFEAIGKAVATVGSKAVFIDDDWIRWCGSDLRIYRWPGPRAGLENLAIVRALMGGSGR